MPAYWANSFCKIGTGDVFAAAYAHYWGEQKMDPLTAADLASRSMSYFADGHSLPLPPKNKFTEVEKIDTSKPIKKKIYVAGPVSTMPQCWLAYEAVNYLEWFEVETFFPFRDVELNLPKEEQRTKNVEGLEGCSAVLGLATTNHPIFEIPYAIEHNMPVVVFSDLEAINDIERQYGTGPDYVSDFVTALYHVRWRST